MLCETKDLNDILSEYEPGTRVKVYFIRNGDPRYADVTLRRRSAYRSSENMDRQDPFLGIQPHSKNALEEKGMRVNVLDNTTATAIGLQDGDLITAINGHQIVDWSDISVAIDNLDVGEPIRVDYQRDGKKHSGEQAIKAYGSNKTKTKVVYGEKVKPKAKAKVKNNPQSHAFLGIISNIVSKSKAKKLNFDNHYGSYVAKVIDNTAADKAGIQPFDYIYGIDEYRTGENQNISSILRKYEPNDRVTLHLIRKTNKKTMPVTLGRRSDARYPETDQCDEPFFGIRNTHKSSSGDWVACRCNQ